MSERYLAIETSSPRLSLAAGSHEKTLGVYHGSLNWRHADTLFTGMEKLLARLRWKPDTLTGIAVSIGPGSFTGIRIGLAAARSFGQVLKIPVIGVSALEIMAAGAPPRTRWLCPWIDALRGQVFSALYERTAKGSLRRVLKETMAPSEEWFRKIKAHTQGETLWVSPPTGCYPEAAVLLDLVRMRLQRAGSESYKRVLPLYIRQAAAVERRR